MIRGEILDTALQTINGARQDQYGNPEDNFQVIADLWNVYMQAEKKGFFFGTHDVAMMMVLLKVARIRTGSGKADSYVDLCGYAALAHDMMAKEHEEQERYSKTPDNE